MFFWKQKEPRTLQEVFEQRHYKQAHPFLNPCIGHYMIQTFLLVHVLTALVWFLNTVVLLDCLVGVGLVFVVDSCAFRICGVKNIVVSSIYQAVCGTIEGTSPAGAQTERLWGCLAGEGSGLLPGPHRPFFY